jgi:hypothetical protein
MSLSVILRTPVLQLLRGKLGPAAAKRTAKTVVEESGLPGEVREVVLGVVKRARLKRQERVAVAEELVGHFAEALAEGATPGDAVREFGDVKTAAKLIRRGMIRKRPVWWHVLRAVRWAAAGLVAVYAGLTVWALSGRANVAVDYAGRFQAMVHVPVGQAGWPYYERAAKGMEEAEDAIDKVKDEYAENDERAPAEKIAPLVAKCAERLELIRKAAACPAMGAEYVRGKETIAPGMPKPLLAQSSISLLLPHLNEFSRMSHLLMAENVVAAERGDYGRVMENIEALLGMARQLRREPVVVSQLVGLGLRAKGMEESRRLMQWHAKEIPEEMLGRLAHVLSGPKVAGDLVSLEGERMVFYDMVQRVYTDDGDGNGRLAPREMAQLMAEMSHSKDTDPGRAQEWLPYITGGAAIFTLPGRKDLVGEFDRWMDRMDADLRKPRWEVDWRAAERHLVELKSDRRYLLLAILAPSYSRMSLTGDRVLADQEAVTTAIAIELYRRQHGRYPSALSELVPELLPSVPVDHVTGGPLVYRLDRGPWGGPVLYSVGVDRKDDLGRVPKGEKYELGVRASDPDIKPTSDGDWVLYPQVYGPKAERVEYRLSGDGSASQSVR